MKLLSLFKGEIEVPSRRLDPRPSGGMKGIQAQVEAEYGLNPGELLSLRRTTRVVRPRQDFMWRCRQVKWGDGTPRYSLPKIGQHLGGLDHTTVLHGVRQHERRLRDAGERG